MKTTFLSHRKVLGQRRGESKKNIHDPAKANYDGKIKF